MESALAKLIASLALENCHNQQESLLNCYNSGRCGNLMTLILEKKEYCDLTCGKKYN